MSLDAHIVVERTDLTVDVRLVVDTGATIALVGPNGAGKSTILRALCGLEPVTSGHITLDGVALSDSEDGPSMLPERRPIAMVFQDLLLFPHMSAMENVAFGLRSRGTRRSAARSTALEWLDRFGIAKLAERRPAALSGGEAQRVALARALATSPRLLLLDEPMSALDPGVRAAIRADLASLLVETDTTTVLVTHDPVDVHALAHRLVVIEHGQVVQTGSLLDVTAHPRTRHVADLVGAVLLGGTVTDGVLTTDDGAVLVVPPDATAGRAFASIRPSAVTIHRARPEGSARNAWPMTVAEVDARADRVRVRLTGDHRLELVAEVIPSGLAALGLTPGDTVWASVKASEVAVTPMSDRNPVVSGPGSASVH